MIKDRPNRLTMLYLSQPVYFVTFCTRNRSQIPSLERAQAALERYADRGIKEFRVSVGRYIIMPDHIHLFVRGGADFVLSPWVAGLKRAISIALVIKGEFWQPGFFDHVVRSDESYATKWHYVCENPVRAGLVERSEHWPFQGDVVSIGRE
jgi:putative transposase